ncbi:hypothetical protein Droror1_Dr00026845 [Drosera rotundifolia]
MVDNDANIMVNIEAHDVVVEKNVDAIVAKTREKINDMATVDVGVNDNIVETCEVNVADGAESHDVNVVDADTQTYTQVEVKVEEQRLVDDVVDVNGVTGDVVAHDEAVNASYGVALNGVASNVYVIKC